MIRTKGEAGTGEGERGGGEEGGERHTFCAKSNLSLVLHYIARCSVSGGKMEWLTSIKSLS